MKTKNTFLIILIFFAITTFISAEKKYPEPRRNQVIVVTSADVSPKTNHDFLLKYRDLKAITLNYEDKESQETDKAGILVDTKSAEGWKNNSLYVDNRYLFSLGNEGEIDSFAITVPKDRTIKIDGFYLCFTKTKSIYVYLPAFIEFTIPEDAKYVYIGSFVYNCEGIQFDIQSINNVDQFDDAVKFVKEKYGEKANLIRVPFRNQPEEKKEK